jgi:hypothetical protein
MPASQEQATGTISNFFDTDTGIISETGSGSELDFFQPGAQVQFLRGELVSFLKVSLPNGRVIVRDIKKPTN